MKTITKLKTDPYFKNKGYSFIFNCMGFGILGAFIALGIFSEKTDLYTKSFCFFLSLFLVRAIYGTFFENKKQKY